MAADQFAFYRSIREMQNLTGNPLLIDLAPSEMIHNRRASILCHGLRVCSFSSLETYFKERLEDVCNLLASSGFSFGTLSDELKKFLIVDGVIGLANSTRFLPTDQRLPFVDRNLRDISTFDAATPILTSFGFSPQGSNVGERDVANALKAFRVVKPWNFLSNRATFVGGGNSDLRGKFEDLAKDRHKSAHDPTSQIPSSDLDQHLRSVLTISVAFDIALGKIVKALNGATDFPKFKLRMQTNEPSIRFIDERVDGRWDERSTPAGRSLKIHDSEQNGALSAHQRAAVDMVVIKDQQKRPVAARN